MSKYISEDILLEDLWDSKCESDILRRVRQAIVDEIIGIEGIDIVRCGECRKVREDGGHANCNGYLYCRKWKTLVDEDGYCSWGEREGE